MNEDFDENNSENKDILEQQNGDFEFEQEEKY